MLENPDDFGVGIFFASVWAISLGWLEHCSYMGVFRTSLRREAAVGGSNPLWPIEVVILSTSVGKIASRCRTMPDEAC